MTPNEPSSSGPAPASLLERIADHWFVASAQARWSWVASYALLIFYLSSLNQVPGAVGFMPDKLGHGVMYGLLGLLITRALTKPPGLSKISRGLLAVGMAALYGATDEWHQSFVPGRTAEWGDLAADVLGAGVGAWVYFLLLGMSRGTRTHTRG